jgi:hypothetical protein
MYEVVVRINLVQDETDCTELWSGLVLFRMRQTFVKTVLNCGPDWSCSG